MAIITKIKDRDLSGKSAMTGEVKDAVLNWARARLQAKCRLRDPGSAHLYLPLDLRPLPTAKIRAKIERLLSKPENAYICREIEQLCREIRERRNTKLGELQKTSLNRLFGELEAKIMNDEKSARDIFFPQMVA